MIDYEDMSRRQMIRGVGARLKKIDPNEDVLLTSDEVQRILDTLSYAVQLEGEYREPVWSDLRELLLAVAPKLRWAGYREDEWIQYLDQGIELAHELGDEQAAGILGIELGTQHSRLGDLQMAESTYLKSLDSFRNVQDASNQAWALGKLAYVAYLRNQFDKANSRIGKALKITEIDIQKQAYLHFVQGTLVSIKNEHEETIRHYEQVLYLRKKVGTKREAAVALNDLGSAFFLREEYEQAHKYFNQALAAYREINSPIQQALTQMNIGCIYTNTSRGKESLNLFQMIEATFRQSRDTYKLALLYNNWAWAFYTLGQWEDAGEFYNASIKLWLELNTLWELVNSMGGLGLVYIQQKFVGQAISQFQSCLRKLSELKEEPEYRELYQKSTYYLEISRSLRNESQITCALVQGTQESAMHLKCTSY